MSTITIKVKFGKDIHPVTVDPTQPVAVLKAQLQSITNVPAEGQKLMMTNGPLKDDADLSKLNLNNKMLMLVGSAAAVSTGPAKPVVFAEDVALTTGHSKDEIASNGLDNLGNTCYLNSAVQTLRVIPELRPFLARSTTPTASSLSALYKQLDSVKNKVAPKAFLSRFWQAFPQYAQLSEQGYPMQHDAQEALTDLIEAVDGVGARAALTNRNTSASASASTSNENNQQQQASSASDDANASPTLIKNASGLLTGFMKETTTCKERTDMRKEETQPFLLMPCDIPQEVQTIEQGIERRMSSETVAEENGQELHYTTKQVITGLPQYMFVHLHRFTWRKDSSKKAKILRPVNFPMVLDVTNFCDEKLKEQIKPQQEKIRQYRDQYIEERKNARTKTKFDGDEKEKEQQQQKGEKTNEDSQPGSQATNNNNKNDDDDKQQQQENDSNNKIPEPAVSGQYELCAVISHKGRDAEHGHYVAWVKKAGHWLVHDDDHVSVVSEEDVKRLKGVGEAHIAYLLLYRAYDPESGRPPLLI